ncbi:MAG: cytochrome c [Candidatus Methylomirabilales bacterium]
MRRHLLHVLALAGALMLSSCAWSQSSPTSDLMPGDVVENRQRLMRLLGGSWGDIQAKAKAGNIEAIAVNAETIAVSSYHIPRLFPEGSLVEKSNAKPEIWQRRDEFNTAAKNLTALAEQLRDAARSKDPAAVEARVKEFGAKACGTCHTPFRKPLPRK